MDAIPAADRIIILRQGPLSFHMRTLIYALHAYMFAQVCFEILVHNVTPKFVVINWWGDQLIYMLSALHCEK